MSFALRPDGISAPAGSAPAFLDAVLRGVGQVMFQNNAFTGALFLAGVFYGSVVMGVAAVVGTIASTVTSILLGVDRKLIADGLFGFNGTLVGIALVAFLEPSAATWACVLVASAFSSVLMAALTTSSSKWGGSALTAPFVLTAWAFLLASSTFGRLPSAALPEAALPAAAALPGAIGASTLFEGLLHGVAQVFFQSNLVTGAFFVAGLFVSSRVASVTSLIGSFVGLAVAWGLGASEPSLHLGLFGFNSALTALALGGTFFPAGGRSMALAVFGAAITAVVTAALSAALKPLGMVTLTAPFVLVVWAFLRAKPMLRAGR